MQLLNQPLLTLLATAAAPQVKTTSPKKYCVRPSSGIVEPGSSKEVQVIMQAQREYPPSLAGAGGRQCSDCSTGQSEQCHGGAAAEVARAAAWNLPCGCGSAPEAAHHCTPLRSWVVQPAPGAVQQSSSHDLLLLPADCKDKFLVQCVKLGASDAKEVTPDMFDATKQRDIRCGGGCSRGILGAARVQQQNSSSVGVQQLHRPCWLVVVQRFSLASMGAGLLTHASRALQAGQLVAGLMAPRCRLSVRRQTKLRVVLVGPPKPPSPVRCGGLARVSVGNAAELMCVYSCCEQARQLAGWH